MVRSLYDKIYSISQHRYAYMTDAMSKSFYFGYIPEVNVVRIYTTPNGAGNSIVGDIYLTK